MISFSITRTALVLAVSLFGATCAMAQSVSLGGKLAGGNEVPAVTTDGAGMAEITLDKSSNLLKWKVTYSGLTGPAGAAHFHGPAEAGNNAGVILGFKGSVESPIQGEATVTPAQAADILAGKWYVNVHTAKNPGGEIRAQVVPSM